MASTAQTGKAAAIMVSGRTYNTFLNVPAVKWAVTTREKHYTLTGIRYERFTETLESYESGWCSKLRHVGQVAPNKSYASVFMYPGDFHHGSMRR